MKESQQEPVSSRVHAMNACWVLESHHHHCPCQQVSQLWVLSRWTHGVPRPFLSDHHIPEDGLAGESGSKDKTRLWRGFVHTRVHVSCL